MSIIRTTTQPVNATPRKLKASWRVEPSTESIFSESIVKEINEEIDREIMWDVYKTTHPDWTQVKIPRFANKALFEIDINKWCSQNLKGKFKSHHERWMFELPEDATWFILRWVNDDNNDKEN
jgi:hypothetical protein